MQPSEAASDRSPAENRSDVDNQDSESSEEEMENGENESTNLCQKMKQPAYYSMFYGPLNIRAAGNQFTLINPANGGKYVPIKIGMPPTKEVSQQIC